jgi:hypothetical protein
MSAPVHVFVCASALPPHRLTWAWTEAAGQLLDYNMVALEATCVDAPDTLSLMSTVAIALRVLLRPEGACMAASAVTTGKGDRGGGTPVSDAHATHVSVCLGAGRWQRPC